MASHNEQANLLTDYVAMFVCDWAMTKVCGKITHWGRLTQGQITRFFILGRLEYSIYYSKSFADTSRTIGQNARESRDKNLVIRFQFHNAENFSISTEPLFSLEFYWYICNLFNDHIHYNQLYGTESFMRSQQPLKKWPQFYETRSFITVFTTALHWFLS
jgi:hypothetical protein